MNNENKKISYKNMAKLDFRYITDKSQISNIEEISNIGLILYPNNADVQLLGALMSIPKFNIGYEYYLDIQDEFIMRNGEGVFDLSELNHIDKKIIVMLNGDFDIIDKGSELKSEYHLI